MFLGYLKPAPNNKDIFNVGYCSMCKLSRIWAYQKLLLSQSEMHKMRRWPFDKTMPTKRKLEQCPMCPLWWKSSCELQEMYSIQGPTKENIPTSPFSCTDRTVTIHSTRSYICSNNQIKFLRSHKYRARAILKPVSLNQRYAGIKKNVMEGIFKQMGTMINLLITVLNGS
jgi:hypothetical protein